MKLIVLNIFMISISLSGLGQVIELKSMKEGLDMMHMVQIPKESVIDYVRFQDVQSDSIDILRFDNLGRTIWGVGPLIISSKEPIQVDSLGMIPLKLEVDSLRNLLFLIDGLDTKVYNILPSQYRIRLTYRFQGKVSQYFIIGPENCTQFLQKIGERLDSLGGREAIEKFYRFVQSSDLLVPSQDGLKWRY